MQVNEKICKISFHFWRKTLKHSSRQSVWHSGSYI